MSFDALIALMSFGVLAITNIVVFAMFISKLSARILHCEAYISSHHSKHDDIDDNFKTLHKIEGKLDLLVPHLLKKTP